MARWCGGGEKRLGDPWKEIRHKLSSRIREQSRSVARKKDRFLAVEIMGEPQGEKDMLKSHLLGKGDPAEGTGGQYKCPPVAVREWPLLC